LRRAECCKGDSGGKQPGGKAEHESHGSRIPRFLEPMLLTSPSDFRVVNGCGRGVI
jgi:hypothetical protein